MIYSWDTVPIIDLISAAGLVGRKKGSRKKFKEREIINLICAFDIETTTIHLPPVPGQKINDHSFMYIWQWQFGDNHTVVGRTWDDFNNMVAMIRTALDMYAEKKHLDEPPLLVSWVHNLAYEWQYLAGIYPFKADECFFRKPRKPIYCRMYNQLEFRCSYIQSNMALDKFAKQMGAETHKQSGQKFDYSKVRYPWTPLTDEELEYCIDDVICLVQAITNELHKDGDTLRTIPLTSTGYVRRDCKKAVIPVRWQILNQLPEVREYKMLRAAFRGGNTHANRHYVGKVFPDVESYDMTSCYPAQQLTKLYPIKPFKFLCNPVTIDRVMMFIRAGYAVVAEYEFTKLRLKDPQEPMPYLSLSKTESYDFLLDNGRLLGAEYCKCALTEIDLRIVLDTYTYDKIRIGSAMVAQKGPLPDCYKACIMEYYNRKTVLKGCTDPEEEYIYVKSKNKLNSVYGMSCQDPVHQNIELHLEDTDNQGGEFHQSDYNSANVEKDLKKAHFPYQWGVYTTAYAREALQAGIRLAGYDIIYCDTDSIKTIHPVDFTELNAGRQKLAEKAGAVACDRKGIPHYMGVFEKDADYTEFITQGAKRYAYKHGDEIGVTVSGVTHEINEKTGKTFASEELADLKNFTKGFCFRLAGGTAAVYNDLDDFDYDTGEGIIHITRNVTIVNTTYQLGYSEDYLAILNDTDLYTKWVHDHE